VDPRTKALEYNDRGSHGKRFSEPLFKQGPTGILADLTPFQLQITQAALQVPIHAVTPSRCISLLNLVTAEDLVDDTEFMELYNDIHDKLSTFGSISSIVIPRPNSVSLEISPNVGKVFAKFVDVVAAKRAKSKLAGFTYNSRTLVISFYQEALFNANRFL
jgi:hypothetical protein